MTPLRPHHPRTRGTGHRLFVACYPEAQAALRIVSLTETHASNDARRTAPAQVHLTLLFIGDTPAIDLPGVTESVAGAVKGLPGFTLKPARLVTLPHRQDPRVLVLETDAQPTLLEIHRRLVTRLARPGRKRDRFVPHFTLARLDPASTHDRIDQPIDLDPIQINQVRLMESRLRPNGAEHTPIECFSLNR